MAQFRQSGFTGGVGMQRNGVGSDHVAIGIRSNSQHKHQQSRYLNHHHRRSRGRRISTVSAVILVLFVLFGVSVSAFLYLSSYNKESNVNHPEDSEIVNDTDFLTDVTRTERDKVLKFGHGSVSHGRDSRYWDRDDRRRDDDYTEEELERARDSSSDKSHVTVKGKKNSKKSASVESLKGSDRKGNGLYNEAGRDELKMYEAEYEASLKNIGKSKYDHSSTNTSSDGAEKESLTEMVDFDDEYDDGIDLQDTGVEEYDDGDHSATTRSRDADSVESSKHETGSGNADEEPDKGLTDLTNEESLSESHPSKVIKISRHVNNVDGKSAKKSTSEKRSGSRKKSKRRKFSGSCEMKTLNSTAMLVEPLESRKFARFSLHYTESEDKPIGDEQWEPRFAGHQSLKEREESFLARDQKINCGFIKGPTGSSSTGFDLAEDDAKYLSSCHIAVVSCIFGNSDRLRTPTGKTVSRISRKNVCFVMFVDERSLYTLSADGQMPDRMGFIGLWKIVVVKNLPYSDMRRVGKIPKLLSHRLFTSARYSIWLDSKLRLQLDPLVILEYFLWRKGHEYAISNHYDRHCLWEEVAQNKRLNKYNHTVIDQQFAFYQADGLRRFNASDPDKLLSSNVPEGSFIIRAHTPMSNLFSCLWFNEVDRFTPRDQLSFAYTYFKLRRMNPDKPFYLNMFKDCERRKIAKLYHHRSEEKRNIAQYETQ